MEKNIKQTCEDSNEETQKDKINNEYDADFMNQPQRIHESGSNYKPKQNKATSHYKSQHNQHRRTQSRSRSPNNIKSPKKWISTNAFINFVQDLRNNSPGEKNTKLYQIAGQRWRKMSFEEKQPYVSAAMSIKNQRNEQKGQQSNRPQSNTESTRTDNAPKQEKVNKKPGKNKQRPKKGTKSKSKSNTDSDDGSVTSGTTASLTSEDMSDSS